MMEQEIIQKYWLEEEKSLENMAEIITRMNKFHTKVDILQSQRKKRQLDDSHKAQNMLGMVEHFERTFDIVLCNIIRHIGYDFGIR